MVSPYFPRHRSFVCAFVARSNSGPGAAQTLSWRLEQDSRLQSPLGWRQARLFRTTRARLQLVLLRAPIDLRLLRRDRCQVGSGGPEPYIEATERGLDFAIAGGIINGMAQVLIAAKI